MMEKYITDERTGLKYELVGDYYLVVGDDEPEEDQPIGVWGQRHLRHLKRHHKVIYANLLTSGKLPEYLADIDRRAEELFLRLAKQNSDFQSFYCSACFSAKYSSRHSPFSYISVAASTPTHR